ncbi:hypothetical protein BVY01_04850, partial [bacterium I07]
SKEELLSLQSRISAQVIEQEPAVQTAVDAIVKACTFPGSQKKPVGSFLFLGPTGVGKTYLAEILAKDLFKNEKALIHIDLSSYKHKGDVARLLGASPGYISHNAEGGLLKRRVEAVKCGVLLLDEIEKADEEIWDISMRIQDEGKFTDASSGKDVAMNEFLVISTSNLGTKEASRTADDDEKKHIYLEILKSKMRPEIINRFDDVIVFQSLTRQGAIRITDLLIKKRLNGISEDKAIRITYAPEVVSELAQIGYHPEYNARPLARTIEKYVVNPISQFMIRDEIKPGDELHLDWGNQKLNISKRKTNSTDGT